MPIISSEKKKRSKKAAAIVWLGLFVGVGLYFFHGPASGIMFAIVSSGVGTVANLLRD
jgi:hypothetical protein